MAQRKRDDTAPVPTYRPALATLADNPPAGDDWGHELKLDGYRMGCRVDGARIQLWSRNANNWSRSFPTVLEAVKRLPLRSALLDGELAVLMPSGLTSFQALQHRRALPEDSRLTYFVFDLLHLDGADLRQLPFDTRKARLAELMLSAPSDGPLQYVQHWVGDGPRVLEHACALGVEGIVAKRRRAGYIEGRNRDWLKAKCVRVAPFVIGGFTHSAAGAGLGALLVGYYDAQGALRYAGSVGTGNGFTRRFLAELGAQLQTLAQATSPFADFSPTAVRSPWGRRRNAPSHWVNPIVVIDVAFLEWTRDQHLRHPTFRGFRPDLNARQVTRE